MSTIMRKVNILSRAEAVYRSDRLSSSTLSPCHHSYILAITGNPGLTQDELAKHLCVNKSSVTRQISYLEEHGYVSRVSSESDKRSFRLFPTDKMTNVLPEVRNIVLGWNDYLGSALSNDEYDTLHFLLDKIIAKAEKYVSNREEMSK